MAVTKTTPKRISRSISFERPIMAHIQKVAKKLRRSPNWVVNELVRKDQESDRSE